MYIYIHIYIHIYINDGTAMSQAFADADRTQVGVPPNHRTLLQNSTNFVNAEYRATSLTRRNAPLGPYSRTKHRSLWWP